MADKNDIEEAARKLSQTIVDGDYDGFTHLLSIDSQEMIKQITDYPYEGRPSLIVACENKRCDMIEFLLEHCKTDIDCLGLFNDIGCAVHVKPLWLVVRNDDVRSAEILIKYGAPVNDQSCGTTLLQEACRLASETMVELLVSNNADINVQNQWGSCLRDVVDNPSILLYLLSHGANPNLHSKRDYPLIHLCIVGNYLESLKILLDYKCDWTAKDFDGNDAIEFAALSCNKAALEFLLEKSDVSDIKRYEAFELMGSAYVSIEEEYEDAVRCWKTALEIKNYANFDYNGKSDKTLTLNLLKNYKEPSTSVEYNNMLRSENKLVERSLVVRDKILGRSHPESIHRLSIYGMETGVDGDKQQALDILKYVYTCIYDKYGALDKKSIHIFTHMMNIYGDMLDNLNEENFLTISSSFDFLLLSMTEELRYGCYLRKQEPDTFYDIYSDTFVKFLELITDCFFMLSETEELKVSTQLSSRLMVLIGTNPVDMAHNSLLHFALCRHPKLKIHAHLFTIKEWHYRIAELLLRFNADANARNIDGETPLHGYLRHTCTTQISEDIVQLLVHYGAHIDMCDKEGNLLITSAKKVGIFLDEGKLMSLKCLATMAVLKFNVHYNKVLIPEYLVRFIDMHKI